MNAKLLLTMDNIEGWIDLLNAAHVSFTDWKLFARSEKYVKHLTERSARRMRFLKNQQISLGHPYLHVYWHAVHGVLLSFKSSNTQGLNLGRISYLKTTSTLRLHGMFFRELEDELTEMLNLLSIKHQFKD